MIIDVDVEDTSDGQIGNAEIAVMQQTLNDNELLEKIMDLWRTEFKWDLIACGELSEEDEAERFAD